MPDNTHVPNAVEGYLLQVRHALYELICTDDRVVSVEALDDVAVEHNGQTTAIQTKSSVSSGNPTTNRSVDFWKTIFNWCNYLNLGALSPDLLTLKYVVVSSYSIKSGSIPDSFHKAKTRDAAEKALSDARVVILGENNEKVVARSIKQYIDYCFNPQNSDTVLSVIERMEIDIHSASYDDELRNKFNNQTIFPEYADVLFYGMLGWVQDQVHLQTKENAPAYISAQDYRFELNKQMRGCDQKQIFAAISTQPDTQKVTSELEREDIYIKQLDIIDADITMKLKAANDFLRTICEKAELADRGLVTKKSVDDYHEALKTIWANQKRMVDILHATLPETLRGKFLFSQCSTEAIKIRLQGCDVQSFFGDGSLHLLANEPKEHPVIGWHPRYNEILEEQ